MAVLNSYSRSQAAPSALKMISSESSAQPSPTWRLELNSTLEVPCDISTMAVDFLNESVIEHIHICGWYEGSRPSSDNAAAAVVNSPRLGLKSLLVIALMLFT